MSSGVAVDNAVRDDFVSIKLGHKYRYAVFKIEGESVIKTESLVENSTYEEFVASLPKDDCRYVVYDYTYKLDDGAYREKLLFIHWAPDAAKIRQKMLYASSKDAIKQELKGVVEIQANDISEVEESAVREKVKA